MKRAALAVAVLLAAGPIAGCAIDAATTVAADRPMSHVVNDAEIVLDINKRLLSAENRDLFFNVTTTAWEGRVLLTGSVRNENDRQRAGALVNGIRSVRAVYNEIQVADAGGLGNTANDAWISTKIRARLVAERGVRSINYRWHTVNGIVYVIGRAQDQAELDRVLGIIRDTQHVSRLVHYVALS